MMATMEDRDMYGTLDFEETELRLGLPGGGGGGGGNEGETAKNGCKRVFSETETSVVDLKLNLSMATDAAPSTANESRNLGDVTTGNKRMKEKVSAPDPTKPPAAKAQVVGWPPVRSFRKNVMAVQKNSSDEEEKMAGSTNSVAAFVKVSMDGAPYLRKVDLKLYICYKQLYDALGNMFSSFTIGNCGSDEAKSFLNESKLIDLLNTSEYVPTYEDKDGDWMLVGDVPWEMFVDSCNRLRIMKGSEAIGLAPRAVERCKTRS